MAGRRTRKGAPHRAAQWPVLNTYDEEHLERIKLPLGGIGTGTVSLTGRGGLVDWEVVNRPAKGFVPRTAGMGRGVAPFFALYAKAAGDEAAVRCLEGPLNLSEYEGAWGSDVPSHNLPRFRHARFSAAYPLGQVHLEDRDVPVRVRLEAFNPMIPTDADRSGMPVAVLRYVLTNRTNRRVTASVCGSVPNFVGMDGSLTAKDWVRRDLPVGPKQNRNRKRNRQGLTGVFMDSPGVPKDAEAWGTLALATTARRGVSLRTAWAQRSWGDSLLDFWDEFSAGGTLTDRKREDCDRPMASVATRITIPPRGEKTITFLLGWHFPNRQTWTPQDLDECGCATGRVSSRDRIGNYYCEQYRDAWDAVSKTAKNLKTLERDTVDFVRAFVDSDLPQTVKEAALCNLSTLRSQTCFRTPDGRFYGWEGTCDGQGCCLGSCTHVWNYEQATAFLYGDLALTMRDVEFAHATHRDGFMPFRVHLPLSRAGEYGAAAADGQMGCIMKMYRDWQLSGEDETLRRLWPHVRRALEFAWIPKGWDGDRDGVMEGCQHNTMDVEYYGPNPQMQGWYLGALRAAEEMARHLDETDFADECRRLFEQGRAWTEANLFNGDYYEHEIRPPMSRKRIAPQLLGHMGAKDWKDPELQLGAGCLIDQLVGQYMAHVCGLGYLLDRKQVRKALDSVVTYNRCTDFHRHFNHMRSFVLGDETALLMASYPKGRRPERPFPYYNEVMTGFEHTVAAHLMYEGKRREGERVMRDIRDRYDGRKRSPFDEAECGHHYARAMASWAAVTALTGFHYSAVDATLTVAAKKGTWFWSSGHAWGTVTIRKRKRGAGATLKVHGGRLALRRVKLTGAGERELPRRRPLKAGQEVRIDV